MSALVFLFIAVLISVVGTTVVLLRNHRPTSMESGIDAFRREMQALAPDDENTGSDSARRGPEASG